MPGLPTHCFQPGGGVLGRSIRLHLRLLPKFGQIGSMIGSHVDLLQFLGTLRARWKFGVGTVLLGSLATIVLVLGIAPQYGSSAKLFVSTPIGGQTDYAASLFTGERVATYADLARDPAIMQRVVDSLNLDMTYQELQGRIKTEVVPSTQTIEIKVRAGTPELAQQIAEAESQEVADLVKQLEEPVQADAQPAVVARVASKASFSRVPVSPNIPLSVAVGILLSIFVGVAGAVLRELLDRTVKSRQDVEDIAGSAVLTTLPYDPRVKNQPLSASGDSLSEAFRVLRTNLQFSNLDSNSQMILVSSAVPDEGKTLVATNLALSMAQSGQSVLLIDADMRNPNVFYLLGLENSVGLVSVLVGQMTLEGATQAHPSGVSFLGSGPTPPNPAEVLNTQAMRDLCLRVRKDYDIIIIDAPPMLPVADASILLTEVDGALLLVRYGSTTREQLKLAVARIETVRGKLLGTILNRTPRRSGDAYGYGEAYGYGYGEISKTPKRAEPKRSAGRSRIRRRRASR